MVRLTTLTEFVEEQLTKFDIPNTEKITINYVSSLQGHSKSLEFGTKLKPN